MNVCIIGRGKVGRALARALLARGVQVTLKAGRVARFRASAHVDTWVLAVPDAKIRQVVARLPKRLQGAVVLHCAGARGPEELAEARSHGASVAGFHPLASFADVRGPEDFARITFVCDGDPKAVQRARAIARVLGARAIARPVLGPCYHAAAALVANGAAALAHTGVRILRELGFAQREAERALAGLLDTVSTNVARVGVPRALTGPVVRGDAGTLALHLAEIRALSPELAKSYADVQPLILRCAKDAGLANDAAQRIERVLRAALTSTGSRRGRAPRSRPRPRTTSTRAQARR